jgi:hypothetical protein
MRTVPDSAARTPVSLPLLATVIAGETLAHQVAVPAWTGVLAVLGGVVFAAAGLRGCSER